MIFRHSLKSYFGKSFFSNTFNFSTADKRKVVLFPGNGIGPEISQSVIDIFNALKVPIEF